MEARDRICPHCHADLPVEYVEQDSRLIAMVGAKAAGKTVFTTVLLHELRSGVGTRLGGASIMGWDDQTRRRYDEDFESPLYTHGVLPATTRSAGVMRAGEFNPLVFKFTPARTTERFRRPPSTTILSFFDAAGEDLTSSESVKTHVRYLSNASGIILLIDPLQLVGARAVAKPGVHLPELANIASPANVLAAIVELLRRDDRLKKTDRISKPIAVAFSKIDAFDLPPGTALRHPEPAGNMFDLSDSDDVHAQTQSLLHEWQSSNLDHDLTESFSNFRYFGLSALGESPSASDPNRVAERLIRPYRVADPLLWLLSRFGAVRSTRQ